MSKNNLEIKTMSLEELYKYVSSMRSELFGLKLNAATSHVKDYSQYKKLRKSIARGLTYLTQKIMESKASHD